MRGVVRAGETATGAMKLFKWTVPTRFVVYTVIVGVLVFIAWPICACGIDTRRKAVIATIKSVVRTQHEFRQEHGRYARSGEFDSDSASGRGIFLRVVNVDDSTYRIRAIHPALDSVCTITVTSAIALDPFPNGLIHCVARRPRQ